jgi:hypothetical protein
LHDNVRGGKYIFTCIMYACIMACLFPAYTHTPGAHHANYTQRCFVCVCDARVCVSGMNSFVLINTHTHPAAELLLCGCNKGKRDQIAGRASIFSPALCVIISMVNNTRAKDFSLHFIQLYLLHKYQIYHKLNRKIHSLKLKFTLMEL